MTIRESEGSLPPLLVPAHEAARVLGISERTCRELIYRGRIESVHIGTRRLVPTEALSAYVAQLRSAN